METRSVGRTMFYILGLIWLSSFARHSKMFVFLILLNVFRMVRDGYFGFEDYFKSLCDSLEGGGDFYLLGSDFASYLEAQVPSCSLDAF